MDLTGVTSPTSRSFQFYNSDVQLVINLKAQGNNANLEGGQFVAKQGTNTISGPAATDANGNATLTGFTIGQTYTIEEITPPVVYMPIAPQIVTISIQTQSLNVTNVPLVLKLTLTSPSNVSIDGRILL